MKINMDGSFVGVQVKVHVQRLFEIQELSWLHKLDGSMALFMMRRWLKLWLLTMSGTALGVPERPGKIHFFPKITQTDSQNITHKVTAQRRGLWTRRPQRSTRTVSPSPPRAKLCFTRGARHRTNETSPRSRAGRPSGKVPPRSRTGRPSSEFPPRSRDGRPLE
jgi:hypothetical protein